MIWRDPSLRRPFVRPDDPLDEGVGSAHRAWGSARRLLRDVAALELAPTRVLRLGGDRIDLGEAFPGARVREVSAWSRPPEGWADLVWADRPWSAPQPGDRDPFGRLVAAAPAGALVAVVERLPEAGGGPPPDLLRRLRDRFPRLHEATVARRDGLRVLAYLGRVNGGA